MRLYGAGSPRACSAACVLAVALLCGSLSASADAAAASHSLLRGDAEEIRAFDDYPHGGGDYPSGGGDYPHGGGDYPHGGGRPDRPDSDVPLLPMRSGDLINLRSVDLKAYCNVRDAGSFRNVLACSRQEGEAGPGSALLVIGADFVTDEIREGSVFYLKSQRTNQFCAPQPEVVSDDAAAGSKADDGRMVVICNKWHYDASCEWRAFLDDRDDRVVYLRPHTPSKTELGEEAEGDADEAEDGAGDAEGVERRRRSRRLGCAPRGREGVVVCERGLDPRSRRAALEVITSGWRPHGDGSHGDDADYPSGGGDYPHGGGDWPHGGGGKGKGGKGRHGGRGADADAADQPADGLQWPHGGGGKGGGDKDDKDKLPFRTGSNLAITAPYLAAACDTVDKGSPYGPYTTANRRAAIAIADDDEADADDLEDDGAVDGAYPYDDGGGDDDPMVSMVWCNATLPDSDPDVDPQPHADPTLATATATARRLLGGLLGRKGAAAAVENVGRNKQWDLDGYVLMATDYSSPDVYSGSEVYLKNQNKRKFCRILSAHDARAASRKGRRLPAGALLCDQMTSDAPGTRFVLELLPEPHKEAAEADAATDGAAAVDAGKGKAGDYPSGGGGDYPSGGGDYPSGGGGKGKGKGGKSKKTVLVRLRSADTDMFCAPEPSLRGAPILCDMRHPDPSRRELTTFKLVDVAPGGDWPSGPEA